MWWMGREMWHSENKRGFSFFNAKKTKTTISNNIIRMYIS